MGMEKFLSAANENGVEGLIIPDLPFEEADSYRKIAKSKLIDTIFLAAPSTSPERLDNILKYASGFLYLVGLFGVTGARKQLQSSTIELVKRFVPCTKGRIPLSVGFGVSAPDHVRALVAAGAEGAIVGSAFVKTIEQNHRNPDKAVRRLKDMTRSLKTATKRLR
jgi:tryptophan synthase alpha chain